MNVQVAATLGGRLAWMSDPIDGSGHDSHCLTETAVLIGMDAGNWGRQRLRRQQYDHANQETTTSRSVGLGEGVQHSG
jgi:hypothetical protein